MVAFVSRLMGAALFAALSLPLWAQTPSATGQIPITPQDLEGEVTPQQEHRHRVDRAREIEALDENLFGDSINSYTGAVQFSVTDISIPGNSALSVELRRRFDPNDVRGHGTNIRSGHVFEDWDLDIPHLHGVFAASTGWQAGPVAGVRCAQPNQAQAAPPQIGAVEPDDYWQGNQLYVPGRGDDEMLHLAAASADRPTDGLSYQWATKGLWYFSCLTSTANGVAGDAFLARDPEGNKYWFTQIVEKLYAPITRGGSSSFARRKIFILPTRIEDRFGNWVEYTWSPTTPRNLTKILASDGRQIDIAYETAGGPGGRILSASVGTRTWNYAYTGPLIRGTLNTVTRPDNSKYTYNFSVFHEDHADVAHTGCGLPPVFVYAPEFVADITHPSGANGTFNFKYQRQGRTYVPQNCWSDSLQSGDRYPPIFTVLSLTKKRIEGTGLPSPMEWQWTYPPPVSGYTTTCNPSCPTTNVVEVLRPDGSIERQTFGIRYGENEGLLLTSEIREAGNSLRSTNFSYSVDPTAQPYLARVADPARRYPDASLGVFKPRIGHSIAQQGVTFFWSVNANAGIYSFDRYARPLDATSASTLGFAAYVSRTYFDQTSLWVLGLPSTLVVDGTTMNQVDYYSATALPQHEYRFGQKTQSLTYRSDGTIETLTDNLGKVTTLSNFKRGVPQNTVFHDSVSRSAVVDDNGWISSITDEVGGTTSYLYDGLGRIQNIDYPADPINAWAETFRSFAPITKIEYGIPIGTWKQTIATGAYRKSIWFDVLWRRILEQEWDSTNPALTQRVVRKTHDYRGNEIFKSFAEVVGPSINDLSAGTTRTFDALGRPLTESSQTELGTSTTSFAYVTPFETRVTNPRSFETRLRYFAQDEPNTDFPIRVERGVGGTAAEQSVTTMTRDVWGKVLSMQRTGNGASATRTLLYDAQQRLCQLTEPESGALVMGYDLGGNVEWSAEGRTAQSTCAAARAGVSVAERIARTYDERNRLTNIDYPEIAGIPTSDTTLGYADDGVTTSAVMGDASWSYGYNSLRKVQSEDLTYAGSAYALDWTFDGQGAVSGLVYPNSEAATFLPNALGQPSRSGAFATGATYHANGATAGWTFGNGIARTHTQTSRKLPDRLRDVGNAAVVDEDYGYDANANVLSITDARNSLESRTLTYDAQDRLATGTGVWGSGTFTYDGADNLKTQVLGGSNYTYNYTDQKLASVSNAGSTLISFQYDARGNQTQKNFQALTWDLANRIAVAPGKARYRYDAHGRRVAIEKLSTAGVPTGERTLQVYSQDGVLLYEERSGGQASVPGVLFADGFEEGSAPSNSLVKTTYHYLGKNLVARKDTPLSGTASTTYLHTDTIGSVVAETDANQSVLRRNTYQPFGLSGAAGDRGPNYTGHVLDAATGLVYMQGRYYDPDVGRFLSMDPSAPSTADGSDFNRFAYARNNPYRNVDPDGQVVETIWDVANIGIGVASFGKNVAIGNVAGAAIDVVGIVVDAAAAVVPGVPGGAGATLKAVRAADFARGRANEAKKLAEIGAKKNTQKAATSTGDRIRDGTKPDGKHVEIKDTKRVDNTRQLRGLDGDAGKANTQLELHIGTNTRVSRNVSRERLPNTEIIRHDDLGPTPR